MLYMLEVATEVVVVETKSGHCVLMLCTVVPLNLVDCVGFTSQFMKMDKVQV